MHILGLFWFKSTHSYGIFFKLLSVVVIYFNFLINMKKKDKQNVDIKFIVHVYDSFLG